VDTGLLETQTCDPATAAERLLLATELDHAAYVFVNARPRLIEIAYRILESASETEDVVQEAWLRWQRTDRSIVRNPTAFLATTTTRLALNVAQSARSRHETYAESWLDRADPAVGPELHAERGDEVEHAVLLLLRNLTPPERAAYVLREAFGYPYRQIAEVLFLTTAHARQLVRRAHKRVCDGRRRRPVNPSAHRRLVRAFRTAARVGNLNDLEQLLAADVINRSASRIAAGQAQWAASTTPRRRTSYDQPRRSGAPLATDVVLATTGSV